MNGKYYGKREIRWHSREKDRLEHIPLYFPAQTMAVGIRPLRSERPTNRRLSVKA